MSVTCVLGSTQFSKIPRAGDAVLRECAQYNARTAPCTGGWGYIPRDPVAGLRGVEKGSTGNGREVVGYAERQGRCAAVVGAQMWCKEFIEKLICLPI